MDADFTKVWELAASGDPEALRALRDDCLAASMHPDLSIGDERIAEAEVFARLAALQGGVLDLVELCGVLHMRAARHADRGNRMAEDCADALEAQDVDRSDQLARLAHQELARAEQFEAEAFELYAPIVHHDDPAGAILMARHLCDAADSGNELAASRLNNLFDNVTKERAAMLAGAVRHQEVVN